MSDFLTDAELKELTGASQPGKQKEILAKNKIFYVERTDGKVKVCWHHVHHPMINQPDEADSLINWDAA